MDLSYVLSKSENRISQLNPIVASKTRQLIINSYNEGINIVIVQGFRTMEEQATLYAQGRTTAGSIVTNAKAGYSNHNYGLAVDFALLMPNGVTVSWDTWRDGDYDGVRDWLEVAAIGKRLGFEWGGDWDTFIDMPHFEMCFGLSIEDLLDGKRPPEQEEYMIKVEDANQINSILSKYYHEMEGNKQVQDYTHYLANVIRTASGQPEEQ